MNHLGLLDGLRMLAQNGLRYAENHYDRDRYERMLELVSEAYESSLDLPSAEVRSRLAAELGHVTPKIGADAAVFDEEERLLLVRRSDDGCWGLPCGWVEPSEKPAAGGTPFLHARQRNPAVFRSPSRFVKPGSYPEPPRRSPALPVFRMLVDTILLLVLQEIELADLRPKGKNGRGAVYCAPRFPRRREATVWWMALPFWWWR